MFGHFVRPKPEMFRQVSILVGKCPTIISSIEVIITCKGVSTTAGYTGGYPFMATIVNVNMSNVIDFTVQTNMNIVRSKSLLFRHYVLAYFSAHFKHS